MIVCNWSHTRISLQQEILHTLRKRSLLRGLSSRQRLWWRTYYVLQRDFYQNRDTTYNLNQVLNNLIIIIRYTSLIFNKGLQVVSLGTATGTLSMWGDVVSSGRVAACSKDAFLAYHCASLLSSSHMLPSTPSVRPAIEFSESYDIYSLNR